MFIAAGEVVAAASGMSWAEFVKRRIVQPLGMTRTVMSTSDLPSRTNVATPHKNFTDSIVTVDWYNWDAMAAAGGIISSVSEMAEWLKLQLNQGELDGQRLFSRESSWEMWTVHTPLRVSANLRSSMPSTHFRGYGLGWSLNDYKGRMIVSHGGGYDGMFSRVVLVPEEKLGVVVLTNSMTGISTAIANYVVDAFLDGEERDWSRTMLEGFKDGREAFEARQSRLVENRVEGTSPSLPLGGYTGRYGGAMYGEATISEEDGALVLRLLPNPDLVADLSHLHHDTFLVRWRERFSWFGQGTATFVLDASGDVSEIHLVVPNDDLWFHELELTRR
jgi:CubicO group peptidase (beta-lactamase class C family)